jgi:hypothetical protein
VDAEERIALLEQRIEQYDSLVIRLVAYARTTAKGRMMLKLLGLA